MKNPVLFFLASLYKKWDTARDKAASFNGKWFNGKLSNFRCYY